MSSNGNVSSITLYGAKGNTGNQRLSAKQTQSSLSYLAAGHHSLNGGISSGHQSHGLSSSALGGNSQQTYLINATTSAAGNSNSVNTVQV
jgi:hypothetical protein